MKGREGYVERGEDIRGDVRRSAMKRKSELKEECARVNQYVRALTTGNIVEVSMHEG